MRGLFFQIRATFVDSTESHIRQQKKIIMLNTNCHMKAISINLCNPTIFFSFPNGLICFKSKY